MGANQSFETDHGDVTYASSTGARKGRHCGETGNNYKRKKAKPAAPHRPNVTAVTHNAVSLTWLPPRHALHAIIAYSVEVCKPRQSRQWLTLTKNCQGTRYEARHLDTDAEYVFRVRAENIYGTGKPSAPSEIITTKIFEMSSDLSCYITPSSPTSNSTSTSSSLSPFSERGVPKSFSYEGGLLVDTSDNVYPSNGTAGMVKSPSLPVDTSSLSFAGTQSSSDLLQINQNQYGSVRRRHSFNVRLEGRVSTMLSHSDRFCSSSSINSSTSTIVTTNDSCCSSMSEAPRTRTGSILRNNCHRSSLQTSRKSTMPILLPGTGSNSLNRLRESRTSLKSSSSDVTGNTHILPRYNKMSINRKNRESRNSLGSTASDSNTNSSSTSTSTSSSKEDGSNKAGQGSRLSLQSVLSDVTMSNQSQSSDEQSSRPISFSDNGEISDLGSFLIELSKTSFTTTDDNNQHHNLECDFNTMKNDICLNVENNNDDADDDEISKLKRDLKNMEITEEKLKFHDLKERLKILSEDTGFDNDNINNNHSSDMIINQKDYYQTLDNPWEKGTTSVNSVSENIMAAPFTDDIKLALNARNNNNNNSGDVYRVVDSDWRRGVEGGHERDDFRTLRSVLQSNHMIVKQARSMPEVVGVVLGEGGETTTLTRGKLTTIADEDEEEEAVRVTTL